MTPAVVFAPRAERQLLEIYEWIAEAGDPETGAQFVRSIIDYCESIADMPGIGLARDDIRAGVRTVGFRRRAVIAFLVETAKITILGVYYGGQDYESRLIEAD